MAIAFRDATPSATASAGTTITMSVPTGAVDGDVLVMFVASRSASAPSSVTGWTALGTQSGGTISGRLMWRVASSEPSSYAVGTASVMSAGVIVALSGASTTSPASTQYTVVNNATSQTVTASALGTFSSSNGIDLFLPTMGTINSVPAAPAGYTYPTTHTAVSGGTGTTGMKSDIAYKAYSSVTTVGQITATWSLTGSSEVGHCFIMEAAPGGGTPTNLFFSMF